MACIIRDLAEKFFYYGHAPSPTIRTYHYFAQYSKLKRRTPGPNPSGEPGAKRIAKPARKKSDRVYTWTCQYCGQPFETSEYSQRYCKPTHKTYAYRERKKQNLNK